MLDSILVIRNQQLKVFADDRERRWVADYLADAYPAAARAMGTAALSELVASAQRKAHMHGFREPQEVRKYAHVAFLLGADFESNPKFAWAREILGNRRFKQGLAKLRSLEDAALKHLNA